MLRASVLAGLLGSIAFLTNPATAQVTGRGGTGVDENTELPRCAQPLQQRAGGRDTRGACR